MGFYLNKVFSLIMFRKSFSSLVYKLNSTATLNKELQPFTTIISSQSLNFERCICVSSIKLGTNPGQRSQKISAGQKKGNLISKLVTKLRGAMKLPNGQLELDPTKNRHLARTIVQLKAEGLSDGVIKRTLDPTRTQLNEFQYMIEGPEGILMLIDCETKHLQVARAVISKAAKQCGVKLMVSEGFDRENYFERKGFVSIPNIIGGVKLDEEAATDLAIECSCEEVEVHDETLELVCDPPDFKDVLALIEEKKIEIITSRVGFRPLEKIELDENHTFFMKVFQKKIAGNIDINFNFNYLTCNYDLEDKE